jgi:hypothetical protein
MHVCRGSSSGSGAGCRHLCLLFGWWWLCVCDLYVLLARLSVLCLVCYLLLLLSLLVCVSEYGMMRVGERRRVQVGSSGGQLG